MIINRIYENQNLLSLLLVFFLVGLWTYQHPCTRFWCGNLRERDHLEDPSVDGRIILR